MTELKKKRIVRIKIYKLATPINPCHLGFEPILSLAAKLYVSKMEKPVPVILPPWITPVPMKSNDHLLQQKFYIQIVLTMNNRDWISIYLHLGKSDSFKIFLLQHQHKVKPLIFSHNLLILNIIQVHVP